MITGPVHSPGAGAWLPGRPLTCSWGSEGGGGRHRPREPPPSPSAPLGLGPAPRPPTRGMRTSAWGTDAGSRPERTLPHGGGGGCSGDGYGRCGARQRSLPEAHATPPPPHPLQRGQGPVRTKARASRGRGPRRSSTRYDAEAAPAPCLRLTGDEGGMAGGLMQQPCGVPCDRPLAGGAERAPTTAMIGGGGAFAFMTSLSRFSGPERVQRNATQPPHHRPPTPSPHTWGAEWRYTDLR